MDKKEKVQVIQIKITEQQKLALESITMTKDSSKRISNNALIRKCIDTFFSGDRFSITDEKIESDMVHYYLRIANNINQLSDGIYRAHKQELINVDDYEKFLNFLFQIRNRFELLSDASEVMFSTIDTSAISFDDKGVKSQRIYVRITDEEHDNLAMATTENLTIRELIRHSISSAMSQNKIIVKNNDVDMYKCDLLIQYGNSINDLARMLNTELKNGTLNKRHIVTLANDLNSIKNTVKEDMEAVC